LHLYILNKQTKGPCLENYRAGRKRLDYQVVLAEAAETMEEAAKTLPISRPVDPGAIVLERQAPPRPPAPDMAAADAFVWHPQPAPRLAPVQKVSAVGVGLLRGVEQQKKILLDNTLRFARGLPANNAMLWGARGMGKSSLVKAAHAEANAEIPGSLALIEIHREDIRTLPDLLNILRRETRRCLVFCDDLSFEREDADYKALKSVLDGGIEGRPANVLFYATSNRRHLMPRDMIENESRGAIHGQESVEEKVSLSDRFGLLPDKARRLLGFPRLRCRAIDSITRHPD
jgi:predicted AAA+ superfamily ATPase